MFHRPAKQWGCPEAHFIAANNAVDEDVMHALLDEHRKKSNLNNLVYEITEEAILSYLSDYLAHGQT